MLLLLSQVEPGQLVLTMLLSSRERLCAVLVLMVLPGGLLPAGWTAGGVSHMLPEAVKTHHP